MAVVGEVRAKLATVTKIVETVVEKKAPAPTPVGEVKVAPVPAVPAPIPQGA